VVASQAVAASGAVAAAAGGAAIAVAAGATGGDVSGVLSGAADVLASKGTLVVDAASAAVPTLEAFTNSVKETVSGTSLEASASALSDALQQVTSSVIGVESLPDGESGLGSVDASVLDAAKVEVFKSLE
jgi:hypothetical protein